MSGASAPIGHGGFSRPRLVRERLDAGVPDEAWVTRAMSPTPPERSSGRH